MDPVTWRFFSPLTLCQCLARIYKRGRTSSTRIRDSGMPEKQATTAVHKLVVTSPLLGCKGVRSRDRDSPAAGAQATRISEGCERGREKRNPKRPSLRPSSCSAAAQPLVFRGCTRAVGAPGVGGMCTSFSPAHSLSLPARLIGLRRHYLL